MAIIRSFATAGQASVLALASAERARRHGDEASERLRAEGREAAERAAQGRITAAEQRAKEAEARAEARASAIQAEADARLGTAAAALERALANLAGLEHQVIAQAEAETVRLALAIAARVLARSIETDPAWMRELFTAALSEVPDRRRVVVRCSPADTKAFRDCLANTAHAVPGTERLDIEEDPVLRQGSLLLVSSGTRLDASIAGSWERVAQQLLSTVPRPPLSIRDDGSEVQP